MPLIKWIPEPKLWDNKRIEKDNVDYNKPLDKPLDEQKQELKDSIFGSFKTPEDLAGTKKQAQIVHHKNIENFTDTPIEKDFLEDRKIDENPYSPLVDAFIFQWNLTEEEWTLIKEVLIKDGNILDNLSNIEWLNEDNINQLLLSIDFLESEKWKALCIEKFNKDFSNEIEDLKQEIPWDKGADKELSGQDSYLVEKLGGNYLSLQLTEWSFENKNESISRAFKITLNELMDWKQFKRPDTFDEMKGIVNNPNLSFDKRFTELKKIDTLINTDQSLANWKQHKNFEKAKKWSEKLNLTLKEEFNKLKEAVQIAKNNNDKKQLEAILLEINSLQEEVEFSGDIFIAGDLDLLCKEVENILKE